MGWFAIVKKFTNIAMFVWKFGIRNMVWTEPSRADSQIDHRPPYTGKEGSNKDLTEPTREIK